MQIAVLLYLIWSLQPKVIKTVSHNDYVIFTETLCEGQCKMLQCPSTTVIMTQMIKPVYASLNGEMCYETTSSSESESSDTAIDKEHMEKYCKMELNKEFNEVAYPICTNKSSCFICHRRGEVKTYRICKKTTATIVNYICTPGESNEEVVSENSYVDLSCASLFDHLIIIHKAILIPNDNKLNQAKISKKCGTFDVSKSVSTACTSKLRCQIGPNSLITDSCISYKLHLNYSCVPKSVLKTRSHENQKGIIMDTESSMVIENTLTGPEHSRNDKILRNRSLNVGIEADRIWIATISSVTVFLVIAIIFIIWWCRSKSNTSSNSLSVKAKIANFAPPPSSINKIEVDLSCNNRLLLKTIEHYEPKIDRDFVHEFQGENDDFWRNTISRYNCKSFRNDEPSCSLSAGSSGQMSTYQSESSKGNPSTVFNYAIRDKSPIDQTPL